MQPVTSTGTQTTDQTPGSSFNTPALKEPTKWQRRWRLYKRYKYMFLLLAPAIVWYIIFSYGPLYGIQLAFKDFVISKGINGSPWVGLKHFHSMINGAQDFHLIIRNTLIISFYHIVFGFPAPIVLALLINEVRFEFFKRFAQTLSYLPHFLSWVVVAGFMFTVLSPSSGIVNSIIGWFGFEPIYFVGKSEYFRFTLISTAIWKEIGWGAIIYLAALAGINPQMYEAAVVDGAGRFKQLLYITLPSLIPVISIMFILRIGHVLDAGFDQVLNMYSPATYKVADILDTYVYRVGLEQMQFSFATAVGLFKNVIALILVLFTNYIVKRAGQEGLV
ncbi:MAG: protein lplB [Paenibacillus sp.]|jgi:putative aldouronate transport system permease protein|nr:protein lplB [Paenibacillus sp.]